ncbi:metal/formaldehyde-sensitive transcriptional repressor [Frateuria sp. STR12]|nr:metal/formaldehyde-sensitive transcriptional repressor [Frateuria sp. STR12]MCX7512873.1 metal/formaldehyde-sensitive transcriptional repressor [Frateuria sp. STR12]
MSHLSSPSKALRTRVRRIRGQVEALENALEGGGECTDVLVQIAAIRGAVHGLMMEVLGEHLSSHVAEEKSMQAREKALSEVLALMRTHLR